MFQPATSKIAGETKTSPYPDQIAEARDGMHATPKHEFFLKYSSLVVLTAQTTGLVLLIRYERVREQKDHFMATTCVFLTEIVKLIVCLLLVIVEEKGLLAGLTATFKSIFQQPMDTLKIWVPSIIYTFQNNFFYIGVSNLDAATFAVTYQLKILTTAIFAVAILRKNLSKIQWISLVLLVTGVSMVQIQEQSSSASGASAVKKPLDQDPMIGLVAVLAVCLMSGFAGIFFEKLLKSTPHVSVWMQNVRLAILSIPVAFITMRLKDGNSIKEKGIFFAYDELVWTIVFGYALGGLLVAMCIRYADNILKGFSQSFAVVFACVGSVFFFNFVPSWLFLVGSFLVVVSVFLYSRFPAPSGLPPTQSTVLFSK